MAEVRIGNTLVGDGYPCFVIAEIGINHNGDMAIAKKLIDVAVEAGCNAVKFQKRTIDVVYTQEELARPRENPFGPTNGDLKRGLEFGCEQYREINAYCREKRVLWGASCWDEGSVDFIEQFDVAFHKVASASLTDDGLLKHIRSKGRPVIISTGMSNLDQIDHAVRLIGKQNLILLHSCSTYPAYYEELNLRVIPVLRQQFGVPVGYSGHETGIPSSGGGGPGRVRHRAAHYLGSFHVGVRPGGLTGAQRHRTPGPRHPPDRDFHGRRSEAGPRPRGADHAEAPPRGAPRPVLESM